MTQKWLTLAQACAYTGRSASTLKRKSTCILYRGRRSGEGDVEHGREDRNRCMDCGHEWRDAR